MMESSAGRSRLLSRPEPKVFVSFLLGKIVTDGATLLTLASRLGVTPLTLRKIMEGRTISDYLWNKMALVLSGATPKRAWKRLTVERLVEINGLYQEKGSLAKAGEALGVSRERVRQLLKEGSRIGLFEYKPRHRAPAPLVPKEKILQDYFRLLQFKAVARVNRLSLVHLRKLLALYGVTQGDLDALRIKGSRLKCIQQYDQLSRTLGYHPSTTELQRLKSGAYLASKITRLWGSFEAFRKERNIAFPPHRGAAVSREKDVACFVAS